MFRRDSGVQALPSSPLIAGDERLRQCGQGLVLGAVGTRVVTRCLSLWMSIFLFVFVGDGEELILESFRPCNVAHVGEMDCKPSPTCNQDPW